VQLKLVAQCIINLDDEDECEDTIRPRTGYTKQKTIISTYADEIQISPLETTWLIRNQIQTRITNDRILGTAWSALALTLVLFGLGIFKSLLLKD